MTQPTPGSPLRPAHSATVALDADAQRLLVESNLDYGIFMLDPQGYVASWNPGAERIKGYRADEIIGRHFSTFYPQEAIDRGWPEEELRRAARDGRLEDEGWRIRKDGTRFWANVVITAIRNDTGELIGFGKVSRDVTERRQVEHRVRESEERFRLLVETVVDYAIFMLDPTGHVASWNAGAQRIKQYTADEIIGKHFSIFYPPDANARNWPATELELATRDGRFEDEGWRVRKDGTRFWANVIITALRAPDGTLRGFAKVTRDMTERKAQEERVEELRRQLEDRVRDLDATNRELSHKSNENESFVYSVSHDLRSPLVNLQGFSHELTLATGELRTLLNQPEVPPEIRERATSLLDGDVQESIRFMGNAVRHLGNIIDGLLRLSRVGRIHYETEPVDTRAVLKDILSAMQSSVGSAGATMRVGDLPTITGDRNAIGQIFANIIGNALKSLQPGRPGIIDITASDETVPVFAIRDNGIGIPAEYRGKMFQVFQHVHGETTRGEGMGLAIVRRIVERHGGRIWFESATGEGTTFYFTLGPRI